MIACHSLISRTVSAPVATLPLSTVPGGGSRYGVLLSRGSSSASTLMGFCAVGLFHSTLHRPIIPPKYYSFSLARARTRARAETKTRRVWRSAAAVSEMEFRNLQVM
jgi:hypothetical protein